MGAYIARKAVKLLILNRIDVKLARVGILGLTFKKDVPDLRNSKVPDIVAELGEYGIMPLIHDPYANGDEAMHEYGLQLCNMDELKTLDALILAVDHKEYTDNLGTIISMCGEQAVFIDVKSAVEAASLPATMTYWSL